MTEAIEKDPYENIHSVNMKMLRVLKVVICRGTSLAVQWLRLCLPMQGVWVRSLVGELRSHMPLSQKNQNIKQKQYCNKFNKNFKNGPHQKKKNS